MTLLMYCKLGCLTYATFVQNVQTELLKHRYAASRFRLRVWWGPVAHSPFPHDTPSPRHTNESTPTRLGFVPLGLNCCQKREGLTNLPPTAGSTPRISITTRFPPRSVCPHLSGRERRCGGMLHLNADAMRCLYPLTWWHKCLKAKHSECLCTIRSGMS